jgi:hypothetical protein
MKNRSVDTHRYRLTHNQYLQLLEQMAVTASIVEQYSVAENE